MAEGCDAKNLTYTDTDCEVGDDAASDFGIFHSLKSPLKFYFWLSYPEDSSC